jgi:hypothetical protein
MQPGEQKDNQTIVHKVNKWVEGKYCSYTSVQNLGRCKQEQQAN